MLKREFKLKNSEEVKKVLKSGQKIRGQWLTLFVAPSSAEHCRAAVVVGNKVADGAVTRNRVRRVIFAQLENLLAVWGNRPVNDMVVMVMDIPENLQLLREDLNKCFAN